MTAIWPEYYPPALVSQAANANLLSSYCIALEAWRRGLRVEVKHHRMGVVEISDSHRSITFDGSRAQSLTTPAAHRAIDDKKHVTDVLRSNGIKAPDTRKFYPARSTFADVLAAATELTYPVVIKPLAGSLGNGVIVNIETESELKSAYDYLLDEFPGKPFVLENHITGEDYRIYVINGIYVSATRRVPANIEGDGVHSVRELIAAKNLERRKNPFMKSGLIRADFETDKFLAGKGMTYDSIPSKGERVFLRGRANISSGGDAHDCTDEMPKSIQDAAIRAVESFPTLNAAGVDVLYDPSLPDGENFAIIELNSRCHIGAGMFPSAGSGPDIPKVIIDSYFPESSRLNTPGLAKLGFDARDVYSGMRTGSVGSCVLAPIAEGGYPVRRVFRYVTLEELTESTLRHLQYLARKGGVIGSINLVRSQIVVGGTEPQVVSFVSQVNEFIGQVQTSEQRWIGVIRSGMSIIRN